MLRNLTHGQTFRSPLNQQAKYGESTFLGQCSQ